MSERGRGPLYPTPEHHPHYQDPRVDHTQKGVDRDIKVASVLSEPGEGNLDFSGLTVRIESVMDKGKKAQRLTLNEGTPDEIKLTGRVYGLKPGIAFRNIPAEKRDSQIVHISTQENEFFFKVNGHDSIENGVAYFWGFLGKNNGIGRLPTLIVPRPMVVPIKEIRGKGTKH